MAIEKNDADAMFNLALLYEDKGSLTRSKKYYRMAIKNGVVEAMANLGQHYEMDFDFLQAEKYYKMAIEKGEKKSQLELARIYFALDKNKSIALEHISKAWEQGIVTERKLLYPLILLWNMA
jgi:TPR repeat protein